MQRIVKWLLLAAGVILVVITVYSFYAQFVLDYSLSHLEYALSISKKAPNISSPIVQDVYRNIVDDMAIEQPGKEGHELSDLALLDAASMSFGEASERAGYERATIYLSHVMGMRIDQRHVLLRVTDQLFYVGMNVYDSILSLLHYLYDRFLKQPDPSRDYVYSSILLLIQAEDQQQEGNYVEAIKLYQKYLEYYASQSESGFVSITLAYLHIRIGNFPAATTLLKNTQKDYAGGEEARIAGILLRRISSIKDHKRVIQQMLKLKEGTTDQTLKEKLHLKIALAHLSIYEFDKAEELLKVLSEAADPDTGQHAKFYLAWLYKHSDRLEQSLDAFSELLDQPELITGIEIGTRAQLASLYYLHQDATSAVEHYDAMLQSVEKSLSSIEVASLAWDSLVEAKRLKLYKGWLSMGEAEKANIHLLDLGNPRGADDNLAALESSAVEGDQVRRLRRGLSQAATHNLRDQAFAALQNGRIHSAFDMFRRNMELFPRDGWTLSGLATTYLLLADMDIAVKYAAQGYRFKADEYTASVLAYIKSFQNESDEAVGFYNEAIHHSESYAPAQFNLGCLYLESKEYAKAIRIFDKLLARVNPKDRFLRGKIYNNLGYASWFLGESEKATQYFNHAVDESPDAILARHNLEAAQVSKPPEMSRYQDGS